MRIILTYKKTIIKDSDILMKDFDQEAINQEIKSAWIELFNKIEIPIGEVTYILDHIEPTFGVGVNNYKGNIIFGIKRKSKENSNKNYEITIEGNNLMTWVNIFRDIEIKIDEIVWRPKISANSFEFEAAHKGISKGTIYFFWIKDK